MGEAPANSAGDCDAGEVTALEFEMVAPDQPPSDPDSSRESLAMLTQIGFWLAAGSLVVGFPLCLGCSVFLPERLAPFVFIGVPVLFLLGSMLAILGSVFAERALLCPECRHWIADGSRLSELRRCPKCGRWGRPVDAVPPADQSVHGFPVIVKEERPGPP
jgi:hypothetical protein